MITGLRGSLMLIGLVGITSVSPSLADTGTGQAGSKQPAAAAESAATYDDAELQRFADAALEVVRIKVTYARFLAQKLQEQEEVRQAASEEMEQAVKQHGMSLERYQEILGNIQDDPELAGRLDKHIHESVQTRGPQEQSETPSDDDALPKHEQKI